MVINLCLDRLRSARARLETYVGPWLPEPVATEDGVLGPLDTVELREQVWLAFLVLLQRLSPQERAVFVLREAFNYGHEDIAILLGISVANARQPLRRAREHVAAERPRFAASPERHSELTAFLPVSFFVDAKSYSEQPRHQSDVLPIHSRIRAFASCTSSRDAEP